LTKRYTVRFRRTALCSYKKQRYEVSYVTASDGKKVTDTVREFTYKRRTSMKGLVAVPPYLLSSACRDALH
jgi:hypothetical protein